MTEILAEGFLHGDFGPWLVPDLDERRHTYDAYFAIFADYFLTHGTVTVTDDLTAVALWTRVTDHFAPAIPDYHTRLAHTTGDNLGRFVALDQAMHTAHPTGGAHEYLAFLAVRPTHQGRGLGTRLLRHHHTILDAEGVPAYLEATSARNARLYARHGYQPRYPPFRAGTSPPLQPMWRPPQPVGTEPGA